MSAVARGRSHRLGLGHGSRDGLRIEDVEDDGVAPSPRSIAPSSSSSSYRPHRAPLATSFGTELAGPITPVAPGCGSFSLHVPWKYASTPGDRERIRPVTASSTSRLTRESPDSAEPRLGDVDAVRALITRSMGHWPRDAAYLAEAVELMSLDADDLERDEAGSSRTGRRDRLLPHLARGRVGRDRGAPPRAGSHRSRVRSNAVRARRTQRQRAGVKRLEWSCDEYPLGFYLAMGGQVTGSTPSGIAGDEPLTEMALRID